MIKVALKIPKEWNINFDFVISAKGNYLLEFGITDGMLIFIKDKVKYKSGDIVAVTCKNWVNPILKKVTILSKGQMIFTTPKGEVLEKNKNLKILGKVVFKMDNPLDNKEDEQLDFWN